MRNTISSLHSVQSISARFPLSHHRPPLRVCWYVNPTRDGYVMSVMPTCQPSHWWKTCCQTYAGGTETGFYNSVIKFSTIFCMWTVPFLAWTDLYNSINYVSVDKQQGENYRFHASKRRFKFIHSWCGFLHHTHMVPLDGSPRRLAENPCRTLMLCRLPTVDEGAPKRTREPQKKKLIVVWKFAPQSRTKADNLVRSTGREWNCFSLMKKKVRNWFCYFLSVLNDDVLFLLVGSFVL